MERKMIPHQTHDDDTFKHEIRDRITACRKRLRFRRLTQRTNRGIFSAKTEGGFQDYSRMRESVHRSRFELNTPALLERLEKHGLFTIEQHEVGIT
jgi:hypothetical protein